MGFLWGLPKLWRMAKSASRRTAGGAPGGPTDLAERSREPHLHSRGAGRADEEFRDVAPHNRGVWPHRCARCANGVDSAAERSSFRPPGEALRGFDWYHHPPPDLPKREEPTPQSMPRTFSYP